MRHGPTSKRPMTRSILRPAGILKSTDIGLQDLARRVEKLEASNRLWKFASGLLLLSGISMFLIAAKPADWTGPSIIRVTTVEARDIILKDEEGNVCARLSVTPIIERRSNRASVVIRSDSTDRAVLEIYDKKGHRVWTAPPLPSLVPAK